MSQILIVEHHGQRWEPLSRCFAGRGHRVRRASDAEEALRLAAECPPEVLLVDLDLPDLSPYTLVRTLRTTPPFHECFVVALVGERPLDAAEFEEAGFNASVSWSADPEVTFCELLGLPGSRLGRGAA
ncbi:MAG TPA: response regulator [Candidatus Nitrosotenuis sp.]|jgi:CheY-like chemotaxis protein|nr:response regulator [Candidatus Nitrosotenuis sp.]